LLSRAAFRCYGSAVSGGRFASASSPLRSLLSRAAFRCYGSAPVNRSLLFLTVLVIATCGLIYELIVGTLASYLLGDSITQFSTVIGVYLFALGIGAWLSNFIDKGVPQRFVEIELAVALCGGISSPFLFLTFAAGSNFRVALYGLVLVIGTLVGLEIPLLMRIMKEQLQIFINFMEVDEPSAGEERAQTETFNESLFKRVDELDLSVRSANCLQNAGIEFIWQLVEKTEAEMLKTKNFGRKSLKEIKEILHEMGLGLGMKLDNWPPKAGAAKPVIISGPVIRDSLGDDFDDEGDDADA
jgi:hypothetical protein